MLINLHVLSIQEARESRKEKMEMLKRASQVAQVIKNLPVMQEPQFQSLGREDPLEEGHCSPLQYSCLENSMDRGV